MALLAQVWFNELRYQIGMRLFYYGFRMQPIRMRRGLSLMVSFGYEWAKNNKADLDRVMNGQDLEERRVSFILGTPSAVAETVVSKCSECQPPAGFTDQKSVREADKG